MSKRKLLLADDSITIQKVVNLTFADEGIEVLSVGDGDAAMEKLDEFSPDLVMADVNMPGLNGYQICEKLRQSESLSKIPVILLVGSFEPFDEEEARRVGANDFLTKPFQSIRQLVNKVTVLLDSGEKLTADEAKPIGDSFADTLEMPNSAETNTPEYSSEKFDDEMIQTNQIGSYALDESQKFETKEVDDSDADYAKTRSYSAKDIKDFAADDKENQASSFADKEVEEDSDSLEAKSHSIEENSMPETKSSAQEAKTEPLPLPSSASILDSDDEDFLELPPIEGDEVEEETPDQTESTSTPPAETSLNEPVEEAVTPETAAQESTAESISSAQFSPELIEAIAQKVIEKLSDKAVKEVAWEVVPQMTELIVKQMAEEKLKG